MVHSCRPAAGSGEICAEGDAITKSEGRGDELARWADRGEKRAHLGFKSGRGRKNGSEMRDVGENESDRVADHDGMGTGDKELRTADGHGRIRELRTTWA